MRRLLAVAVLLAGYGLAGPALPGLSPSVLGAAGLRQDGRPGTGAAVVPVTGALVVCPDVRQDGPLRTRVLVTTDAGGAASTRLLRSADTTPVAVGGTTRDIAAGRTGDALLVSAAGPAASALQAEQVTVGRTGSQRGYAAVRCAVPTTDAWWTGGSTAVGSGTILLLANPDSRPAVIDVSVLTTTGPVAGRAGRGITIGGTSRTAVQLADLAPGADLLAVHVQAEQGRFAGGVRWVRATGASPGGVDWAPPGVPARDAVVPALPAAPGRRILLLANPGHEAVVVTPTLLTAAGPRPQPPVTVGAGAVTAVDLRPELGAAAAIRVASAGGPVLAAGLAEDADAGPARELALTGPVPDLGGTAAVPDWTGDGAVITLLLTAPDAAATATVTTAAGPRVVHVPAGSTVSTTVSSTGGTVVSPDGALVAEAWIRGTAADGPLATLVPLVAGRRVALRPAVHRDPG